MSKKALGQFYTSHADYICSDFDLSMFKGKNIIEPFVGNGDLINFLKNKKIEGTFEIYDKDPKIPKTVKMDTILNPPDYKNKFIITNPPYLARNKSSDKTLYDKYDANDLYKCHIKSYFPNNKPEGGILIIPLNFWCSIREQDCELRKLFLESYKVLRLNIFEEKVFDDTTYTVCSFLFIKTNINEDINTFIYPSKKNIKLQINSNNNWKIGGEIYNLPQTDKYKITRLLKNGISNTKIKLFGLDSGTSTNNIRLEIVDEPYYGKNTDRVFATIVIEPKVNLETQKHIVEEFNKFIKEKRDQYHSLFLTNYRESKDHARKRISFDLVYSIINNILLKKNNL